jgi:ABC-type nickel/cobalt efflux system permease component RcnA
MTTVLRRLLATSMIVGAIGVASTVGGAPEASAHPLGNATVNHYDGLQLFADHILDTAVVDVAEIPTLQRLPLIDTDGDGAVSPAEATAYADAQCPAHAATVVLSVGADRAPLTVTTGSYVQLPGAAGLPVGRLECHLAAPADLSRPTTVSVEDQFDSAGIGGWHEITATGDGVTLQQSPVPASSISDELRRYPNDLLSSPLDVRTASITTTPGAGISTYAVLGGVPGAGAVISALNDLSTAFNNLVGTKQMSVGVALLAVLLSILLGAGHAFLPGHGKTIMAAYLVGKRGRLRDVVTVGATVTVTHTVGVLVLGVLLSASAALAPTAVEQVLAIVSGLVVAGVGLGLLRSAVRRRRRGESLVDLVGAPAIARGAASPRAGGATAVVEAVPQQATGHGHGHNHGHGHGHGHGHERGFGRGGLIGLGVAGGLVPSPSALLVLLAAIALGRTLLGIVLVLGYGLGMALALTFAGLLLVRLQDRITTVLSRGRTARLAHRFTTALTYLPVLTAVLVIIVGAGLVLRALSGSV